MTAHCSLLLNKVQVLNKWVKILLYAAVRGALLRSQGSSGGGQKRRKVPLVNAKCTMEPEFPSFSSSGVVGLGMLEKKGKLIRVTFTEVWQLLIRSALAPSKWIVGEPVRENSLALQIDSTSPFRTIFLSGDAKLSSVWVSSYWLSWLLFP